MKKNILLIPFITILITYIIVKVVKKLTGFHYDIDDGFININFLIDLAIWGFVYLSIDTLIKRLLPR
jgi:hypothetical protein